jgi:hypothetical protein
MVDAFYCLNFEAGEEFGILLWQNLGLYFSEDIFD